MKPESQVALPAPRRERGSALLIILALIGIGAAFLLVSALMSNPQIERDKITAAALAQAKEALIGYAATYGDTHLVSGNAVYVFGHLPCPDLGTGIEGSEASSCSGKNISALGRLPWKTLGLPPLRDSSGECLWYAVSGSFKSNTKPDLLNWDSDGQFQILAEDGVTVMAGSNATNYDGTHPVAVIFSAGPILPGQDRTPAASGVAECGGNYTPSNYLDTLASINNAIVSATANAITRFISGKTSDTFNDRLLFITADEIFAKRIEKRSDFPGTYFNDPSLTAPYGLLQKTAQCIANYGKNNADPTDKRLPWAAPLTIPDFANDTLDDTPNLLAGRPPFKVKDSDSSTNNTLVSSGNSYRLLDITTCPAGWNMVAGNPATSSQDGWWDKWKDHLFYAVADAFKPSSAVAKQTTPCSSGSCLTVDGIGPYAAVLIFAGKKLASPAQSRDTLAQKTVASNYLEGVNASSIAAGTGTAYTKITSATANDVLVCIKQDLTIDPTCANPTLSTPIVGGASTTLNGATINAACGACGGSGIDTGVTALALAGPPALTITATGGNIGRNQGGASTDAIGVYQGGGAGNTALQAGESLSFKLTGNTAQKFGITLYGFSAGEQALLTFKNSGTIVGTYKATTATTANIDPGGVFDEVVVQALGASAFWVQTVKFCDAVTSC
jgi:type II secretory pathway pseudopilin PulG